MPSRVVLSFQSKFIPFDLYASAINDLSEMLEEIDRNLSDSYTLEWGVKQLRGTDKAIIAVPRLRSEDFEDKSDVIIPVFLRGLRAIKKKPERPSHFSDDALNSAKDLSLAVNGDITRISITGSVNGKLARPIHLNEKVAKNVQEVIGPRYTAIGSIEGKLEMISIRRPIRFGITHALTKKSIKCRFQSDMLDQVKSALGKRIIASGIVHYNSQHEPVRVDVEWIRVLRESSELPTTEELGGSDPDFTGDMDTIDYLRSIRG